MFPAGGSFGGRTAHPASKVPNINPSTFTLVVFKNMWSIIIQTSYRADIFSDTVVVS
jgi:hypothetical protein